MCYSCLTTCSISEEKVNFAGTKRASKNCFAQRKFSQSLKLWESCFSQISHIERMLTEVSIRFYNHKYKWITMCRII